MLFDLGESPPLYIFSKCDLLVTAQKPKPPVEGLPASETQGRKLSDYLKTPAICRGAAIRRPQQAKPAKTHIALAAAVSCSLRIADPFTALAMIGCRLEAPHFLRHFIHPSLKP